MTTIEVRGNRAQVRAAIRRAVAAAATSDIGKALQTRIGLAALGNIRRAFVVKAQGGTDECGLSWPPLSPKTIAYSRRHPGVPKSRPNSRPSWMLTERQKKAWWEAYRKALASTRGDKARSARIAWAKVKASGAKTLIGEYGGTPVEILRDTGLLLNSLTPGATENQIFQTEPGAVIVGTNRKWAYVHHYGSKRIPQRRLWPDPKTWTPEWWADIEAEARAGLIEIVSYMLRNP